MLDRESYKSKDIVHVGCTAKAGRCRSGGPRRLCERLCSSCLQSHRCCDHCHSGTCSAASAAGILVSQPAELGKLQQWAPGGRRRCCCSSSSRWRRRHRLDLLPLASSGGSRPQRCLRRHSCLGRHRWCPCRLRHGTLQPAPCSPAWRTAGGWLHCVLSKDAAHRRLYSAAAGRVRRGFPGSCRRWWGRQRQRGLSGSDGRWAAGLLLLCCVGGRAAGCCGPPLHRALNGNLLQLPVRRLRPSICAAATCIAARGWRRAALHKVTPPAWGTGRRTGLLPCCRPGWVQRGDGRVAVLQSSRRCGGAALKARLGAQRQTPLCRCQLRVDRGSASARRPVGLLRACQLCSSWHACPHGDVDTHQLLVHH